MFKLALIQKGIGLSFLAFALIPLLPYGLITSPVILFTSLCLLHFIIHPFKPTQYKKLSILIAPFICFLISALYSKDIISGLKMVSSTRLALLIIPLSFFILSPPLKTKLKNNLNTFYFIFVMATVAVCVLYLCYLPFAETPKNPSFRFPTGFFFKSSLTRIPYWRLVPITFSLMLVIATILLCKLFENKVIKKPWFFTITFLFFGILLLLVSKMALLSLSAFMVYYLMFKVKNKNFRWMFLIILILSIYPVSKIPSVKYEIEEIQYFLKGEKRAKDDTNEKRNRIIQTAIALAQQINPIIGTGIGDVQHDLNTLYQEQGYNDFKIRKYDTHNQYFSMFLGTGIIGLLSLLILIAYLLAVAIKQKQMYLFFILAFIFLHWFTENLLERQLTVFVFCIFSNILIFLKDE